MKRTVLITLLTLLFLDLNSGYAQPTKISDIYLEPDTLKSGTYADYEAYYLEDLVLYKKVGRSNTIQIMDKSTDVELFSFKNDIPETHLKKPRFFRSFDESNSLTIIMLDVSEIFSQGVHIFIVDHNKIHHSGFLEYAADNFNFSSLALYSEFEQVGDKVILSFQEVDLIDLSTEEIVNGAYLQFEILEDNIRRYIR